MELPSSDKRRLVEKRALGAQIEGQRVRSIGQQHTDLPRARVYPTSSITFGLGTRVASGVATAIVNSVARIAAADFIPDVFVRVRLVRARRRNPARRTGGPDRTPQPVELFGKRHRHERPGNRRPSLHLRGEGQKISLSFQGIDDRFSGARSSSRCSHEV